MNNFLQELMMRWFNEQKWREQKASEYGVPFLDPSRDPVNKQMKQQFPTLGVYTDSLPLPLEHIMRNSGRYKDLLRQGWDYRDLLGSPAHPLTPLEKMWHKPKLPDNL